MTTLSLAVLNIVWWKAIVIGALAYVFCAQGFAAKWIERIAFILALLAICVWVEALPSGPEIKSFMKQLIEEARESLRR